MAPPSETTATTAGPAPAPPSPQGVWGKPPRSARSSSWQRPQHQSGRQPSSPRRPPTTPNRRPRSQCRPGRPPRPRRLCSRRPAPERNPGCARSRGCRPGLPCHGSWHAAGPREGGAEGREGAKYCAHTNPSHTITSAPKPYPPKADFPEGRPQPVRPPLRCPSAGCRASPCRSCGGA